MFGEMEPLSKREAEIAELFAWGASKKEVADQLCISYRTVQNHSRNIYEKTGCSKVNELSAWWFCHRFHIPMSLSPLLRKSVAVFLLSIYLLGSFNDLSDHRRVRSSGRIVSRSVRYLRRNNDYKTFVA